MIGGAGFTAGPRRHADLADRCAPTVLAHLGFGGGDGRAGVAGLLNSVLLDASRRAT